MFLYHLDNAVCSDVCMNKGNRTVMYIHISTKEELEKLKIIPEKPYNKVIERPIASFKEKKRRAEA
jgi:hypothetical protein